MTDEHKAALARACNRLPFVKWDRFVASATSAQVYGWIARDDGRSDFVLLMFYDVWGWEPEDCTATTSSAEFSEEIQERLRGTVEGHVYCQRVDEHFGTLIEHIAKVAA